MVLRGGWVFGKRDLVSERLKLSQGPLAGTCSQAFVEERWIEVAIGVVARPELIGS